MKIIIFDYISVITETERLLIRSKFKNYLLKNQLDVE